MTRDEMMGIAAIAANDTKESCKAKGIALRSVLDFMDDPYATTRRAIVRAAAEIGKAMP